ncbi:DnaJ C-terminal domain-containing protein [Colwellia sp. 12G3]|uniref:DnaJ C-terminal domain-containing protein n=1 Tax=Colwellia sp. 12G3 TaxID=2058299 RepID=UPI000C31E427|nr:DnaJ C-terminal domain-containing protein [Colwellia sp. 12G3]PKI18203.1 cytochrome C biogenesis protein [Colwellia sp. 12G3]
MEYKDYYQVMGVENTASQADIKRAYKKLARKHHPDVSKAHNAEVQFKELGEAYEVLKDPEKRAAYDQLGSNWQSGQPFSPPPDWDQGFEYSDLGKGQNFSDFFESIFGQPSSQPRDNSYRSRAGHQERGDDHHAKISIDIEDAFHGATRTVTLHSPEVDAQGHVSTHERQLKIKIPVGITQDQQIRLAGQGYNLSGDIKGDLYLQIQFNSHPLFRVDGKNIELDLPITPWEAALGATINAPTPAGKIDLKIPANSKSNSKLRIKGRGIPGEPCGDLFAVLKIVLPDGNSVKAKTLYKTMAKELAFNPREKLGM